MMEKIDLTFEGSFLLLHFDYTRQKKKRNSKIFPLSFPFNAKMLIDIKYLFLTKSHQNSSVA